MCGPNHLTRAGTVNHAKREERSQKNFWTRTRERSGSVTKTVSNEFRSAGVRFQYSRSNHQFVTRFTQTNSVRRSPAAWLQFVCVILFGVCRSS
nr:hypothetical protein Iba_chr05bCG7400 [Ipomoea batatas]